MSHFSTIKTKLREKEILLKALLTLGLPVDVNQELENPVGHDHAKVRCDITLGTDIGFRLNRQTKNYELVTDLQTWKPPTPPQRMIEKITQEYAIELISREIERVGFEIEIKKRNVDNNVEIVATRWV